MKKIAAGLAVSLFALGCGGGSGLGVGGGSASNQYTLTQENTVAGLQALGTGESLYTGYSSILNLEQTSPGNVPPLSTPEPLGFDGLYYEFSSFTVSLQGSVTANLLFFSDSAGKDQVGTGTLTATQSGSTTTAQLNVDMTQGPLPIDGGATVTVLNGVITEVSGQANNQVSNASITFDYKVQSKAYTLEVTFGQYTLTSQGQLSTSGSGLNITGTFICEPLAPSGSLTENANGSGSMTLNVKGIGQVGSSWNSSQNLAIDFPGGYTITVSGATAQKLH